MKRASDQFLAGSGFALDQHRGIGRSHHLNATEHGLERRAFPDHGSHVLIEADLVLQVQLLGGQFVLDLRKFAVSQGVFGGNANLARHLHQQIHFVFRERFTAPASQVENSQYSICAGKRNGTVRAESQAGVLAIEG